MADSKAVASSAVTVGPKAGIFIVVTPSSVKVLGGATQQFTATVTGNSNHSVNWFVDGRPGGNSTFGTISATGLYTAPQTIPNPPTIATPHKAPSILQTRQRRSDATASSDRHQRFSLERNRESGTDAAIHCDRERNIEYGRDLDRERSGWRNCGHGRDQRQRPLYRAASPPHSAHRDHRSCQQADVSFKATLSLQSSTPTHWFPTPLQLGFLEQSSWGPTSPA